MRPTASPISHLRGARAWEALAALVAAGLYLRTVAFGWVYDDQMEVVRNTFVRSLSRLPEMFTTTVWTGSGMETYLYRPLALVTYALNYRVSGADPWSYHLVNALLHAAAAALVVRVGLLWRLSLPAAGLGGLLFAAHPIHVEAVAAVFGRKDLLAALFVLGLVLTHRGALERGGWRRVAAPLLLLAAMLSKEVGVVGLVLVAVQDLGLEEDRRAFLARREVPLVYASYVAVVALFLLVRSSVTGGLGIPDTSFWDNPLVSAAPGARLATALVVVGKGLSLLALPVGQSPDYSYDAIPVVASFGDPRLLATLVVLAGVAAVALHPRSRGTPVPLGVAWYALALLPAANLLLVSGTIFAERTLYLPSVAFCLLAGAALARLARVGRSWAVGASVVALGGLAAGTLAYSRHFSDDLALFRRAVAAAPASTKAHHKLGEELLRAGELGDALRSLDLALEIAPGNVFAEETLGVARQAMAERWLAPDRGDPGDGVPPGVPRDADILYTIGTIRRQRGGPEAAEACWRAALEVNPRHAATLGDLGAARMEAGDFGEAERLLEGAVEARPRLAPPWFNLGRLRLERGDAAGAFEALERFVELAGGRYPSEEAWARGVLARRAAP